MTAKCWMAGNFPMSMRQLIPILDIVAHANKHLGRVSSFMRKYGDMDLFPVKLQVSRPDVCAHPLSARPACQSVLVVPHRHAGKCGKQSWTGSLPAHSNSVQCRLRLPG